MIRLIVRFFNTEGLLKDSSVLFAGMAGVHVLNLLFQAVMGRCLEEEEYALLVSLLGALNILIIPLGVVSSAMNRYTSLLIRENRAGDVRRLVIFWVSRFAGIGALLSLACFLFPCHIAAFFHLDRLAPILIFGVILTGIFCRPVFDGVLMGMQRFGCWSFSSLSGWGVRLLVGSILVLFVSPFAGWGLLGHGLGFYVATVLGIIFISLRLRGLPVTEKPLPEMQHYMWGCLFVLLGNSILMTGDVVLIKHFYPGCAADFSKAAILGRLVFFVPQAFATAMFPKVVSEGRETRTHRALYYKTLLMTLATAVFSALVFTFVVKFMLWFIYGISDPSDNLVLWSRMLAWAMVPVSLLSVLTRFILAQHRLKIAMLVPLASFVYVAFCYFSSTGPGSILVALGTVSTVVLLLLSIFLQFVVQGSAENAGTRHKGVE